MTAREIIFSCTVRSQKELIALMGDFDCTGLPDVWEFKTADDGGVTARCRFDQGFLTPTTSAWIGYCTMFARDHNLGFCVNWPQPQGPQGGHYATP